MSDRISYERRNSSLNGIIDTEIHSIVERLLQNDHGLPGDVLRCLTIHSRLLYETHRVRERLLNHPVARDLLDRISTTDEFYPDLVNQCQVEAYDWQTDSSFSNKQQVVANMTTKWMILQTKSMEENEEVSSNKRRKLVHDEKVKDMNNIESLYIHYLYSRLVNEESNVTNIVFKVSINVGMESPPKQFILFEMSSISPYPRSYYEDTDNFLNENEEEEGGLNENVLGEGRDQRKTADTVNMTDMEHQTNTDDSDENNDIMENTFGETIQTCDINPEALNILTTWISTSAGLSNDYEFDISDLTCFFLAVPAYEDEWIIDERIYKILFSEPNEISEDEDT